MRYQVQHHPYFNERGCNVTVVPYNTSLDEIMAFNPDGVLISNGPGNPTNVPEVVELVKSLRGRLPIFGIGLDTSSYRWHTAPRPTAWSTATAEAITGT